MTGNRARLMEMRRALPGLAASKGSPLPRLSALLRPGFVAGLLAGVLLVFYMPQAFANSLTSGLGGSSVSASSNGAQKERQQLGQMLKQPKIDSTEPMLLQADEMVYDNEHSKITAKGNVEIYYGNYTLLADRVVYDRAANTLTAEGNVSIKDPDGAVITADHITLTDDFRDGFIDAMKLVTKDDTRIVAQSASRQAGNVTVFENGWFTPCKVCEEDPSRPPTWRIRAKKITHRRDEATITYNNAFFDFFGVPVLWMPYFQSADPTVKRKSGFLMPGYGNSNVLGTTVMVPYYFALSDTYDFTFAPMYTSQAGTLLQGFWRQGLSSGGYRIDLAGVFDKGTIDAPTNGNFRGSIWTQGKFALNPYYSWGWDILAETDDTFRRVYNLDSKIKTDRVDQIYLEGLHDRNYLSMRFYNTQSLLFSDQPFSDATVYPIVDYDYIVNRPILGGELSFNSNAMAFSNKDGVNSDRLITEANWRRQMIDGIGQVYTPFARLRGDLYNVSGVEPNALNGSENLVIKNSTDDFVPRGDAVAGFEYRYPFVATTGNITHVFEPIGQIIARPDTVGNQQNIPNEDALSLVFDDTLLFDIDKFSGYDRIETGTRANVGARYTAQLASGAYARAVFGESYQLAGQNAYDNAFYATSGLATDPSDYVGGLYLQAASFIAFSAQSRFNQATFAIERTDLGSSANYGPVQLSVNYADVIGAPGLALGNTRQEVLTQGVLALTQDWSLLGNLRYDIETAQTITDGLGLRYQDDCFNLAVTYERSFIKDQNIAPEQRFLVSLNLKYLGGYGFQSDAFGLLGPGASGTSF